MEPPRAQGVTRESKRGSRRPRNPRGPRELEANLMQVGVAAKGPRLGEWNGCCGAEASCAWGKIGEISMKMLAPMKIDASKISAKRKLTKGKAQEEARTPGPRQKS